LGGREHGRLCAAQLLELGFAGLGRRQVALDAGPPLAQLGLVGDLLLQGRPKLDEVVGEQAQPGVARVGLHDRGATSHLGLPAERFELAPELGREVLHPREVGLHRVELAQRLFLALAVLEDPGSLLDEAAALLGPAESTASSWPCPTMTCISRPMPESLSSSWTSSSRQPVPLIAYSDPPLRNIVRGDRHLV
jgi:hypothetical protein